MKRNLLLLAMLLFFLISYSQVTKKNNFHFVSSIQLNHLNSSLSTTKISKRLKKKVLKQKNKLAKKQRKFYKLFIFKKNAFKTIKLYNNIYKVKKTPKGFHIVEGLFDEQFASNTLQELLKTFNNNATSFKVLYGYQFAAKRNIYITSYPGCGISTIINSEKKTFLGNMTKDIILGLKIIIDLNI